MYFPAPMKNFMTLHISALHRTVRFLIVLSVLLLTVSTNAQTTDSSVVQLSGQIFTDQDGELKPVPNVSVFIKNSDRGTYSDLQGFFSVVGREGETVVFSSVGYKQAKFVIPDTLNKNRYSIIQLMTRDTVNLPETVIYPWPSRKHFKIEFLAMDVTEELQQRAYENLADKALAQMREYLPPDGKETTDLYLKQLSQSHYSEGQLKPMPIFSPLAWKEFFQAWKNGEFKRDNDE